MINDQSATSHSSQCDSSRQPWDGYRGRNSLADRASLDRGDLQSAAASADGRANDDDPTKTYRVPVSARPPDFTHATPSHDDLRNTPFASAVPPRPDPTANPRPSLMEQTFADLRLSEQYVKRNQNASAGSTSGRFPRGFEGFACRHGGGCVGPTLAPRPAPAQPPESTLPEVIAEQTTLMKQILAQQANPITQLAQILQGIQALVAPAFPRTATAPAASSAVPQCVCARPPAQAAQTALAPPAAPPLPPCDRSALSSAGSPNDAAAATGHGSPIQPHVGGATSVGRFSKLPHNATDTSNRRSQSVFGWHLGHATPDVAVCVSVKSCGASAGDRSTGAGSTRHRHTCDVVKR